MASGVLAPVYGTYSFLDVTASITGPGGTFTMGGPGDGSAEEGITIAMTEETNTQTIGSDGSVMNTLHASQAGTVTTRFLKISGVNYAMQALYNFQRRSSAYWGQNTITIRDVARMDTITCVGCAFVRMPQIAYTKAGAVFEWEFHAAVIMPIIGKGVIYNVPLPAENVPLIVTP